LLYSEQVRQNLMNADLVIPSLDAALQQTFTKINRPHPSLDINTIIAGLKTFSAQYIGRIWFEVMIVEGINDNMNDLQAIKDVVDDISPDKIQINTVMRPSAESNIVSPDAGFLLTVKTFFGEKAEIIGNFQGGGNAVSQRDSKNKIIEMLQRRPCTMDQIVVSIGIDRKIAVNLLGLLVKTRAVQKEIKGGAEYFVAK